MNSSIDAAVLHLARLRRLNATSCLVEGPAFAADAAALKNSGLQIGLHLNFTESLGLPGLYRPVSKLIVQAWLRRLDTNLLHGQIVRQLNLFEQVLGQGPDFVDGHQHVHQFAQIRETLLAELERRYAGSRPWLRSTRVRSGSTMPLALRVKSKIIELLGARRFARLARGYGFALNGGFLGAYDFQGGESAYRDLLRRWLEQAREGDVLMCHPAQQPEPDDGLGVQRMAEYRVLASDQAEVWMAEQNLVLA
ncbi:MAG: ChbG/HpnK family deacetylase [Candidimonas sp.]|nr:MAG: ChbG/HpnK family deacetylase [Candidimonas sp.]TAM24556.1 MAG: ChbG/HpnK family deacetylase [Candidimonas sp.]TAM79370.1 MAG: ChbG/HpnK family deacetylase [Candidimonas sp.]